MPWAGSDRWPGSGQAACAARGAEAAAEDVGEPRRKCGENDFRDRVPSVCEGMFELQNAAYRGQQHHHRAQNDIRPHSVQIAEVASDCPRASAEAVARTCEGSGFLRVPGPQILQKLAWVMTAGVSGQRRQELVFDRVRCTSHPAGDQAAARSIAISPATMILSAVGCERLVAWGARPDAAISSAT